MRSQFAVAVIRPIPKRVAPDAPHRLAQFVLKYLVIICDPALDECPVSFLAPAYSLFYGLTPYFRRQKRTHVFLVMHHPPAADSAVIAACRNYGVKTILCGHFHTTGSQAHGDCVTYWVSGTAKARDENGLRYNVFKVHEDRVEQVSLPLEQTVGRMAPTPNEAKP